MDTFDTLDINGDLELTSDEINLSPKVFNILDKDSNGGISAKELSSSLEYLRHIHNKQKGTNEGDTQTTPTNNEKEDTPPQSNDYTDTTTEDNYDNKIYE